MEERPLRVIVRGQPRWVPMLVGELADSGVDVSPHAGLRDALFGRQYRSFYKGLRAHIVHIVYARIERDWFLRRAQLLGQRAVMHWIGSDVLRLRAFVVNHKRLPELHVNGVDAHLADSPQLQQELAKLGIESRVVRLLPKTVEAEILPLPDRPAVLSYWSDARPEFYGSTMYLALARRFPDIAFYVVGATGSTIQDSPSNVKFLGEVKEMEEVYRKVSVLFRFVQHDSLSAMVLEALARGRYVLYCYEFPHTAHVIRIEDAIRFLQRIAGENKPNEAGAAYVREHYFWRKEMETLKEVYRGLLESP